MKKVLEPNNKQTNKQTEQTDRNIVRQMYVNADMYTGVSGDRDVLVERLINKKRAIIL